MLANKRRCLEAPPRYTRRIVPIVQLRCLSTTRHDHGNQYKTGTPSVEATEPTIYALSSAPGRAAIAVIRISGPACLGIYHKLCPNRPAPKPRLATVRTLYTPNAPPIPTNILDNSALLLYFPCPRTATGESILELHIHGGPATVRAVLAAIPLSSSKPDSIRYAEPGEFTRRAFLNDRLDLTQVEALGDTLAATTEQQRLLSIRGSGAKLVQNYEDWRQTLLAARGELEALIDFSEDQHFDESPAELCKSVAEQVGILKRGLALHVGNAVRGELLRKGIGLAFLGAPNVGKSSLLNRVVGREAAIVSREAGTTRDVVEVGLDLGGYFVRLGDTAGLRGVSGGGTGEGEVKEEIVGQIEREGMRRARERAAESDVVVVVLSFEQTADAGQVALNLDPEVITTASKLVAEKNNVLVAINKTDRIPADDATVLSSRAINETLTALPGLTRDRIHLISCQPNPPPSTTQKPVSDPGNLQTFLQALVQHFASLTSALNPSNPSPDSDSDPSLYQESLGASERHRLLLESCISALEGFLGEVSAPTTESENSPDGSGEADIVVAAEYLRRAAECLARITGRGEGGDVEEVLGVVFEKFCVGK